MAVLWLESKRLSGKRCMSDQHQISSYSIDTVSRRHDENKEKHQLPEYNVLMNHQVLRTNMKRNLWKSLGRITTLNWDLVDNWWFPFFFPEFMIQTRVKLFRRILDTAIQCDVLFTFPREVRYCMAVYVSMSCGTRHLGSEANSESTRFPVTFSHHSPRKYN